MFMSENGWSRFNMRLELYHDIIERHHDSNIPIDGK